MKQFFLFLCCCLTSLFAMAQSDGQLKRVDAPANAKEYIKAATPEKVPHGTQGQAVLLSPTSDVTKIAEPPLPATKKVVSIRKYKNIQTGETHRKAVTQAEFDLEQQRSKMTEQEYQTALYKLQRELNQN
jgi:hypothetical protein